MFGERTRQHRRRLLLHLCSLASILIAILSCQIHAFSQSPEPIRINKVLKKTHSRRQADQLIADGRLSVNNEPVHSAGQRVIPYRDVIRLDGRIVEGWEELNHLNDESSKRDPHNQKETLTKAPVFDYIKYWKPIGVTCTTDRRIRGNLIDALRLEGCNPNSRIFPVGRLDKETSGILLMTSDGRLPNASLRGKYKHPKTYLVRANRPVADEDVQRLRDGVVITTVAQRDGNRAKPLTAPTLPCTVRVVPSSKSVNLNSRVLEITLVEGRNRQVRKMMEALGYRVLGLHRKSFMEITLDGLEGDGDWCHLNENEMNIVQRVLDRAEHDDTIDMRDVW